MSKCPKCNSEVTDGSQFCVNCGEKIYEMIFCPNCGKQTSAEFAFCQSCGASVLEEKQEEVTSASEETKSIPGKEFVMSLIEKVKALPKKTIIGIAGIAAVVIVALFAIIAIFGGNANYALYLKDKEIYFSDLKKNSDPIQLSDDLLGDYELSNSSATSLSNTIGNYAYLNKDGSILYFPDKIDRSETGYTVYYKKTKNLAKAEAVKIDSNIVSYVVNNSDTLVTYIKGSERNLYQYNMKKDEKEKIASEVRSFKASEDGKTLLFMTSEGNVYYKANKKEKEKIASEVESMLHISEDLKTIYYFKEGSLYKQQVGKDKVKISSDVYSVLGVYESGEVYYLKSETLEVSLMDYVYDDMKDVDAAMTKPTKPTKPYWYSFDGTYDEYQAALEEYNVKYAEYQEEYQKYQEKNSRDNLRSRLESATMEKVEYTLYYYDGKDEVVVTDAYSVNNGSNRASEKAVIIYHAYSQSDVSKVNLSDVESYYDVRDMVESALYSSVETNVAVKGNSTVIDHENAYSFDINSDGTMIYYVDEVSGESNSGDLYQITIKNGKVSKASKYDSDVYANNNYFINEDEYVYFKDYKNSVGELYLNKEKVDDDVYVGSVSYKEDLKSLFFYTDYESEARAGVLNKYSKGKVVKIADDVALYSVVPNGDVLYICDYSKQYYKGELHIWDNGKTRKIDDDVAAIIPIRRAE